MTDLRLSCCSLALLAALAGCRGFELAPPDHFVELEEEASVFDLRATNADGVVLAVRELRNDPEGDLDFWVGAIQNRLRTSRGYATLETRDVAAASGERGRQLVLGHDEGSRPYVYWVTLFVTDAAIFVVEAGGRRDEFERVDDAIAQAIAGFRVR